MAGSYMFIDNDGNIHKIIYVGEWITKDDIDEIHKLINSARVIEYTCISKYGYIREYRAKDMNYHFIRYEKEISIRGNIVPTFDIALADINMNGTKVHCYISNDSTLYIQKDAVRNILVPVIDSTENSHKIRLISAYIDDISYDDYTKLLN